MTKKARKYTDRIDVYALTSLSDGFGGLKASDPENPLFQSWCKVTTLSIQRSVDLGLNENNTVIEIIARHRNDFSYEVKTQTIEYKNTFYNILRIENVDLENKEVRIIAASNA